MHWCLVTRSCFCLTVCFLLQTARATCCHPHRSCCVFFSLELQSAHSLRASDHAWPPSAVRSVRGLHTACWSPHHDEQGGGGLSSFSRIFAATIAHNAELSLSLSLHRRPSRETPAAPTRSSTTRPSAIRASGAGRRRRKRRRRRVGHRDAHGDGDGPDGLDAKGQDLRLCLALHHARRLCARARRDVSCFVGVAVLLLGRVRH